MSSTLTVGPDGLATRPVRVELRTGCAVCAQTGPHRGAHSRRPLRLVTS